MNDTRIKISVIVRDTNGYIPGTYTLVEMLGLTFELRVPGYLEDQIKKILDKCPLTYEHPSHDFYLARIQDNPIMYKVEDIGNV